MGDIDYLRNIDDFEAHYQYDSTYMRELLRHSPDAYAKFDAFMPLSAHREKLPPAEFWVAKLATMQQEDCGPCLQLCVRMALEAGISREIVEACLKRPNDLPEDLKDVYDFSRCISSNTPAAPDLIGRMETRFGEGAMLEFGVCIASAKVFPTIKRAAGYAKSCSMIEIEI